MNLVLIAACGAACGPLDGGAPGAGWAVGGGAMPAHVRVFTAELPDLAPAEVRCVLAGEGPGAGEDDASEVHVVTGAPARLHRIVLSGLLPDRAYDCTATAGLFQEALTVRTDPAPSWVPAFEVEAAGEPWGDYVLLNHAIGGAGEDNQQKLLVVDRDGGLRWSKLAPRGVPDLDAQLVHAPLATDGAVGGNGGDSGLDGGMVAEAAPLVLFGGGHGIVPTLVDLEGNLVWEGPAASTGRPYHHHVEWLEGGEVLALAHDGNTGDGRAWTGFTVEIIEARSRARSFVWASQEAVDAGTLPVAPPGEDDPYHANAVQRLPNGDLRVNLYAQGQILAVDGASGEIRWRLGPGGDFRLLDEAGEPAPEAAWFHRAHAPEQEGDRVLLYDNGVGRPGGSFSRALELELDEGAGTARIVWSWTEPGWYEPIWGDVDRLPNDGVLVTKAHCALCGGADDAARTEVVEVDRDGGVVWRLTFTDPLAAGYRAQAVDGCDLFANGRYCAP